MIIVAICEDERYILEELRRKVEKYINEQLIKNVTRSLEIQGT